MPDTQTPKMSLVKKVLALGSLGFAVSTFFCTLGLLSAFAIMGIEVPEEIRSANQISLGAMIASFAAVVNYLLGS